MTITRGGPKPNLPTPRRGLGGVLITIDDLDALMQLLDKHPDPNDPNPVTRIEFSGGHFDEANDLRQLSDSEMQSLTVKNGDVSVELSEYRAEVVTRDEAIMETIERDWARHRQTRQPPARTPSGAILMQSLVLGAATVASCLFIALMVRDIAEAVWMVTIPGSAPAIGVGAALIVGAVTPLMLRILGHNFLRVRPDSYAIIEPRTQTEYRDRLAQNKWPRAAVWVAVVGVVVALLGIGATIGVAFIPKP